MHVHYTDYSVNPEWKKNIKKDPFLTKEQKRKALRSAEFDAFKSNVVDTLVQTVIALISIGIVAGLYYLFVGLFKH